MITNQWWKKFYIAGYEDPPAGDPPAGDPPAGDPPTPAAKKTPKTFDQAEIDRLMAKERAEFRKKNEKLAAELTRIQGLASTTQQDRDALAAQIEELQNQHLSKEELLKRDSEKLKSEADKERKKLTQERDTWQTKYTRTRINQEIIAAAAADAYNPEQIIELLAPKARLAEVVGEDNKPTGEDQVRVKLPTVKDGKPTTLDLTVAEAITLMKTEVARYGNLFKSNLVGGVGGANVTGGQTQKGPPSDPAQYRKWRTSQQGLPK